MEELQYGYPYSEELRDELEAEFSYVDSPKRLYIIAVICVALATGCFVLFAIFGNLLLPVAGAILLASAVYVVNQKTKNIHLLEIEAYETYMKLDYYNTSDDRKIQLELLYKNVVRFKMDEDNYTSVKIEYKVGKQHFSRNDTRLSNGSTIRVTKNNQEKVFLRLNEGTPEQEFFLFVAPYFCTSENNRTKINKRFGSHDHYREIYYGVKSDENDEDNEGDTE